MGTWKQGEHVAIIGDTGSGKTFLESYLLTYRQFAIVFRTKPDDITFDGFRKIRSFKQIGSDSDKYLLTPSFERQAYECYQVSQLVWKQGGWCIDYDELFYVTEKLRQTKNVEMLLTQGRSKGISVVCGMQRPVGVTRFAISQATHIFCFQAEGRDVKGTLVDATTPALKEIVPELPRYNFVYWNRKTRELAVAMAQDLPELLSGKRSDNGRVYWVR